MFDRSLEAEAGGKSGVARYRHRHLSEANLADELALVRACTARGPAGTLPVRHGGVAQNAVRRVGPADVEKGAVKCVGSAGCEHAMLVLRVRCALRAGQEPGAQSGASRTEHEYRGHATAIRNPTGGQYR